MIVDEALLEFAGASKHRKEALFLLAEGAMTPRELSQAMEVDISQASRTLKEFEEEELVECATPESKKGRIYELTETGHKVNHDLPRFLKKDFLARVVDRLNEERIAYGRNLSLEGEAAELRPDLTVFADDSPSLALIFKGERILSTSRTRAGDTVRERELQSLAFRANEAKKTVSAEVGLVFYGIRREALDEETKRELENYEKSCFDHVFFDGEMDRILEAAREKTSLNSERLDSQESRTG